MATPIQPRMKPAWAVPRLFARPWSARAMPWRPVTIATMDSSGQQSSPTMPKTSALVPLPFSAPYPTP
jgi:hypothetical protein